MTDVKFGQRCIANGAEGIVRFLGTTSFAAGQWVGVDLDTPSGKNDGSIQGVRYFTCEVDHGVFVRPSKVLVLPDVATSQATNVKSDSGAFKVPEPPESRTPRISRVSRPVSRVSLSLTGSLPSPVSKAPSRSLSRQSLSIASHEPSVPECSPARQDSRYSTVPSAQALRPEPTEPIPSHPSSMLRTQTQASIRSSSALSEDDRRSASVIPVQATLKSQPTSLEVQSTTQTEDLSDTPATSATSSVEAQDAAVARSHASHEASKTIDDLKSRIQSFEAQRVEDVKRLSNLGALEAEKQAWTVIRTKLRDKLQAQQVEIRDLKDRIKVLEISVEEFKREDDSQMVRDDTGNAELLEIATLDREMAEEERDQIRLDLETLQARNEELALELDILREESSAVQLDGSSKTTSDYIAVDAQNQRLKEALIRLKEITKEQDKALEEASKETDNHSTTNQDLRERLALSESQLRDMSVLVEDLRGQIDISIGVEDMLESLTERNLSLGEQLENCRMEIADLEALQSLNNEIDEAHQVARDELRAELVLRDAVVHRQVERIVQTEAALSLNASTIANFRDLVTSLQDELGAMRHASAKLNDETTTATQRSGALIAENTVLKANETKGLQVEYEHRLQALATAAALEHLEILHNYMPETYENDRKAVEAYIQLRRIGNLAHVLYLVLSDRVRSEDARDALVVMNFLLSTLTIRMRSRIVTQRVRMGDWPRFQALANSASDIATALAAVEATTTTMTNANMLQRPLNLDLSVALSCMEKLSAKIDGEPVTFSTIVVQMDNVMDTYHVTSDLLTAISQVVVSVESTLCAEDLDVAQRLIKSHLLICRDIRTQLEDIKILSCLPTKIMVQTMQSVVSSIPESLSTFSDTLLKDLNSNPEAFSSHTTPDHLAGLVASLTMTEAMTESLLSALLADEQLESFVVGPPPWEIRGHSLRQSFHAHDEKHTHRDSTELAEVAKRLQSITKVYDEERVKNQALQRRVNEQSSNIGKLEALKQTHEDFEVDRKAYEDAVEELSNQIENLQEELRQVRPTSSRKGMLSIMPNTDVASQEIQLLQKTILHLNKQLSHVRQTGSTYDMDFLAKPLYQVPPLYQRDSRAELHHGIRSFVHSIRIIDFTRTPPSRTEWTPKHEKCGFRHFLQEEEYTRLLSMSSTV